MLASASRTPDGTGTSIDHINDEHLKKIRAGHKDERVELAAMSDENIDFSDIPEMTDADWKHAVRGAWVLFPAHRAAASAAQTDDRRHPLEPGGLRGR